MDESAITTHLASLSPDNSHAVVIGGSIAGLLAARVLADHFDKVTIVERDLNPEKPEPRPGVPQSHHVHALLTQGQQILEQLFPGLKAELAEKGSVEVNWTADWPFLSISGWAPRFPSEMTTRTCSRNLLETIIRKRLENYSHLQFLEACQATHILANTDNTAIKGIRVRQDNGTQAELLSQLVVDASGRNSKTPKWLQNLGYQMPEETVINSFLGYASRWYQRPADFQADWKGITLMSKAPERTRGGVLFPIEGDRWIVTLAGVGRDYPPTDRAGFLDFARSLRSRVIYEAIEKAQPLSPIYSYRRTENRLRHYEKLSKLPENLVALGDAVCVFNPVYGQGMTVAALGALTLDQCLKQQNQRRGKGNLIGFSRCFQKQLAKVNITPWLIATGEDLRWPTTVGAQPDLMTRLMHRYIDRVTMVANENAYVYQTFAEVMHMLKPPTAFFQPRILAQVLWWLMRGKSVSSPSSNWQTLPKLLS